MGEHDARIRHWQMLFQQNKVSLWLTFLKKICTNIMHSLKKKRTAVQGAPWPLAITTCMSDSCDED